MRSFSIPLATARRIAEIHSTTIEHINSNGGHLWTPSGAKLIMRSNGKRAEIISHKYDFSDLEPYKAFNIVAVVA
jgi:hypothetical protein